MILKPIAEIFARFTKCPVLKCVGRDRITRFTLLVYCCISDAATYVPNLIVAKPSTMIKTFTFYHDISAALCCCVFYSTRNIFNHAQLTSAVFDSVCHNIPTCRRDFLRLTCDTYEPRPAQQFGQCSKGAVIGHSQFQCRHKDGRS